MKGSSIRQSSGIDKNLFREIANSKSHCLFTVSVSKSNLSRKHRLKSQHICVAFRADNKYGGSTHPSMLDQRSTPMEKDTTNYGRLTWPGFSTPSLFHKLTKYQKSWQGMRIRRRMLFNVSKIIFLFLCLLLLINWPIYNQALLQDF